MRIHGASNRCILSIVELEAEREREARQKADDKKAEREQEACQKADDRKAIADAKLQGKEAVVAARACVTQEHAAASQAKKVEKLRITAECQAEKVRIAAEHKARQVEKRVRDVFLLFDVH